MNSVQLLASKVNGLFVSHKEIINNVVPSDPNSPSKHKNDDKDTISEKIVPADELFETTSDKTGEDPSNPRTTSEPQTLTSLKNENISTASPFRLKLKNFIVVVFNVVIFFPNLIVLQPLLYIWFGITFPLRFLEERYGSSSAQAKASKEESTKLSDDAASEEDDRLEDLSSRSKSKNSSSLVQRSSTRKSLHSGGGDDDYNDLATINSIATNNSVLSEINELKSPTSPLSYSAAIFSKLPKVLFSPLNFNPLKHQRKTLILDLDETLIHSLSKTNRMSTAHMVEVKLHNNLATLYYVYKRPFCDEFLRLVSKWFDLYIFTASAREYADPVINWLERDRKYFNKRFYRDHCTLREGAGYIKDLSVIGIDLAKVILVDNSPISYSLNYENALDIEGWIDDPTDNELMQLLPLLNSLRFVTDVRYILGLKSGEESFK